MADKPDNDRATGRQISTKHGLRAVKPLPNIDVLRAAFSYNPQTGRLTHKLRPPSMFVDGGVRSAEWKSNQHNSRRAGKLADSRLNAYGHRVVCSFRAAYLAHRIVWFLNNPDDDQSLFIDHINGDGSDNRLSNLRLVPHCENMRNRKLNAGNANGVHGVHFLKRDKRWQAFIMHEGQRIFLGSFGDKSQAIEARLAGEARYGYHANHGSR